MRVERIQAAIQAYYRLSGKNNRPVPRRRFLKKAHQWLLIGGNLYRLLEALAEPLPKTATIRDEQLITSVQALEQAAITFVEEKLQQLDQRLRHPFIELAIRYCILWEGRGKPPPRSTFKSSYYYQELCKAFGQDPDQNAEQAWAEFEKMVKQAARPALHNSP